MSILTELKDPRIHDVTVTFVEVSPDLRHAKVHVSVMGTDTQQKLAVTALQHAAGFLQQRVGRRVQTRYTPRLKFVLDQGVKRSIEVARILREVLPAEPVEPSEAKEASELDRADGVDPPASSSS